MVLVHQLSQLQSSMDRRGWQTSYIFLAQETGKPQVFSKHPASGIPYPPRNSAFCRAAQAHFAFPRLLLLVVP